MNNLAWTLLFLPLAVAAINHLLLRKTPVVPWLSTLSALATLVISGCLLKEHQSLSFPWLKLASFQIDIGIKLDQLSTGMMLVVTGVGFLVHVFSLAYMHDDAAKNRYFTGLSMFMFSMTGIVLSNNFIMTFIFWELVGLSSYLLIGHWFEKDSAADASKKAFLCNRVGDFGFMIGILMLWGIAGSLNFDQMAVSPVVKDSTLVIALLCVFCGAVGKSAQVPLHVWLPDAMEGPTPVSALIHAATMVAAGVYMLFRLQLSLGAGAFDNTAGDVISWVGGFTALVAALMAVQQDDIKRILAYSTLSQLGYMVMAVGLGSGEAGMFHLFTHAWFKALLFLGSGAVIFACHHEQDIWKMGGLLKKMPITGTTFAIGTAALMAVPFTSGFWSKEEILTVAYSHNKVLFAIAVFVAFLTTFYMTRAFVVAFLGKPRDHGSDHAHEVGPLMWLPLAILATLAIGSAYVKTYLNACVPEEAHSDGHMIILGASLTTLVLGLIAGFTLYRGKSEDPLNIPLLKNRFYVDHFYDQYLVRYGQNALAAIVHFLDELFINSLTVIGLSRLSVTLGNCFRSLQSGSLQLYGFAFGLGVVLVIYFTVFN